MAQQRGRGRNRMGVPHDRAGRLRQPVWCDVRPRRTDFGLAFLAAALVGAASDVVGTLLDLGAALHWW